MSDKILLPPHVKAMAAMASTDTTRTALTGVLIEALEGNRVRLVASDARMLGVAEVPCEDPKEFPNVPAMEAAPNSGTTALIDARTFREAFKGVPKTSTIPVLTNLALKMSPEGCTFASVGGKGKTLDPIVTGPVRQTDGKFPDYQCVMPSGEALYSVVLNIDLLVDLLKTAQAFCHERTNAVRLDIMSEDPCHAIRVVSCDQELGRFTGMLMPLTIECPMPGASAKSVAELAKLNGRGTPHEPDPEDDNEDTWCEACDCDQSECKGHMHGPEPQVEPAPVKPGGGKKLAKGARA